MLVEHTLRMYRKTQKLVQESKIEFSSQPHDLKANITTEDREPVTLEVRAP